MDASDEKKNKHILQKKPKQLNITYKRGIVKQYTLRKESGFIQSANEIYIVNKWSIVCRGIASAHKGQEVLFEDWLGFFFLQFYLIFGCVYVVCVCVCVCMSANKKANKTSQQKVQKKTYKKKSDEDRAFGNPTAFNVVAPGFEYVPAQVPFVYPPPAAPAAQAAPSAAPAMVPLQSGNRIYGPLPGLFVL